jgi:hypothetical protein
MKQTAVALLGLSLLAWVYARAAAGPIVFEDATDAAALARHLEKKPGHRPWRYAHGAGWGDVNGDGKPDLYLGAFAARKWYQGAEAPVPNMLFLNGRDGFSLVEDKTLQFLGRDARCAGVLFADLDNDGDLDLVVANHVTSPDHQGARLFENHKGKYRDVTPTKGDWPARIGMRNVSVINFNNDGLLDLVIADGSYGKAQKAAAKLIVLANQGKFQFKEVSAKLGLPQQETLGLGLAIGDVNQDNVPDIFVAGSNRLFVSDPFSPLPSAEKDMGEWAWKYHEAHPGRFAMPPADVREGLHCGAAFGDLNGDGLLDLVTTEHGVPARIHVYVNNGIKDGIPDLAPVSDTAGIGRLFPRGTRDNPIKTTHVAIQDIDNDGKPDLFLAVIFKDERGRVQPVVLKNLSEKGGQIKLAEPPFEKMVGYYAPAPLADYDGDGRVDVFLASWFENLPNYLFRNVTEGGNWLTVRVAGKGPGLNTMGIGAVVRIYEAGHAGEAAHLLGRKDIAVGTGYASTEEAVAHLGLGTAKKCDVEVTWGKQKVRRARVAANQAIAVEFSR